MIQTIWLLAVDGEDRIFVQTKEPTEFQKDAMKPTRILRADIEIPGVCRVDAVIRVTASPVDSKVLQERLIDAQTMGEHWTDAIIKGFGFTEESCADRIVEALVHAHYMGEIAAKTESQGK